MPKIITGRGFHLISERERWDIRQVLIFFLVSCTMAACGNSLAGDRRTPQEEAAEALQSTAAAARTQGDDPAGDEPGVNQSKAIRVLSMTEENNYPDGLTFKLVAEANKAITKINLYYHDQSSESLTIESVEFIPGTRQAVSYTWDTSRFTVTPSIKLFYHWVIEDDSGQRLTTVEQEVSYDDLRYPWQELADPDLIVRWYEGDQSFGENVFRRARQALDQMKAETGQSLEIPIIVLLYANVADFASWHFFVQDWVGGQAFPSLGITTQIISPRADPSWIADVIPHEIAHIFFFQTISSALSSWPSWLDEGFAQYYEAGGQSAALSRSNSAAREGRLVPLTHLSGGFGRDPEQVGIAYDLSLSAVVFMLETWPEGGLQALIENVRQGKNFNAAMKIALGVSIEEFEAAWRTWLGAPSTPSPSATPRPTFEVILPPARATTASP
ncbi:MAG: hypothetical protein IIC78_08380 [Chloroflexi bacterium]|nr:hypothetical protein [Chloroflexota bacterium]